MSLVAAVALASLAAWAWLVLGQGGFWLGDQRLDGDDPDPAAWPSVTAVVPARDEADVIARVVASLAAQDYPGPFRVVLVDDESRDGTGDVAHAAAAGSDRLTIVRTPPRPAGWVGKMWAVQTGVRAAMQMAVAPDYLLLTDADVVHSRGNVRRLVQRAEARGLALVSLMVRLHCARGWERLLVPAFVYFFQKLYPFRWVNDPHARTAAAAGGCMLVHAPTLGRIGGIAQLRGAVIDDCALGAALKRVGRVWLGVTTSEHSVRPYVGLGDVWHMVARSAYTQLGYSPVILAGTILGLALVYLVPPLALLAWPLHGSAVAATAGAAAWLAMAATFLPTLALYGRSPLLALALPLAGVLYAAMTFDSARRHWTGRGAVWKGRVGAGAGAAGAEVVAPEPPRAATG
ncbi:MAG: glycosyltransferase [bacterium]|nr:glycosyltransferase [bacterium]